ncbi:BCCT family transporter [Pseudoalteromonas sp. NZS127]|uniref:BCCT family transporter n=2 Tax=Pseudoalteromonas TaxID=53246 RepID=UPI0018CDA2D6|nr:BCCT family transporter [Pseudoalteromonas sp. NZS127]MBO7927506.1 BCCT family transporter [Pseudoalteromonas sp. K222D]|tara:strand:+ start:6611 stop:8170 length:1560 start_codon:yes stop_codon:yes gene_type:complete
MNTTSTTIKQDMGTLPCNKILPGVDIAVLLISGGVLVLFAALALYDIDLMSSWINTAFAFSTKTFGAFWQILLLSTFVIGIFLAIGRTGRVVLGGLKSPEISTFKWISIIMCTLLAGGGVFWAAAEPMAHFISSPPHFGGESGTKNAAFNALAQSFMHWGFLAWAILGSLTGIVYMHLHYEKGLPLKPRTLLYPVFGDRVMKGAFGAIVDSCCVLAVVAGTVGPIGFLGLQVSFGLEKLFGIPDTYTTQVVILFSLIAIYTLSAVSGVTKGIQMLSSFNVILAVALMLFILVMGPTAFIFDSYIQSFGLYINNFIPMATFRADTAWLDWWTVFFWGWFLGYGPLMAMFVARISRGRTIREMIMLISVIAPVITCFWFTIVGGSGIFFELANPGVISEPFTGFNLPAALLAITEQLPMGFVISVLFLILTTIFVATTGDSMTYSVSMVMTGTDHPQTSIRVFWGVMMGVMAAILISIGSGGISALQSFIVVTAVPVSFVLLPSLWTAPKIAKKMADEQGL